MRGKRVALYGWRFSEARAYGALNEIGFRMGAFP